MITPLRLRARLAAVVLTTILGALPLAAQEITWVETRFHRVHLLNGNFIDGQVLRVAETQVHVRLPVGDMSIRKDSIDRIELMKLRSILEKPKLDPPLKKSASTRAGEAGQRLKTPTAFAPAPASPELVENVAKILSRLRIAKPDQKDGLVDLLARLDGAAAYEASLLPTVDEEAAFMLSSALMRSKDAETAPYLIRALESDKAYVKIYAVTLLSILRNKDHAAHLRPLLSEPVPAVKATVIEALQALNDADAIGGIAELVASEDDMVRNAAINASIELGRLHDRMPLVMEQIRFALNGSRGRAAKELLSAVGRGKMTELWTSVLPFLYDADPMLRRSAAVTLQSLAVPESVDAIVTRLEAEDDPKTLVELAKASSQLKSAAAVPGLIRLLGNGDDTVVQTSAAALVRLTRQKFGVNQDKWTEWWNRLNAK